MGLDHGPTLSHKKEIAKIAGISKIENPKRQDLCQDTAFKSVVISENQW